MISIAIKASFLVSLSPVWEYSMSFIVLIVYLTPVCLLQSIFCTSILTFDTLLYKLRLKAIFICLVFLISPSTLHYNPVSIGRRDWLDWLLLAFDNHIEMAKVGFCFLYPSLVWQVHCGLMEIDTMTSCLNFFETYSTERNRNFAHLYS